MANITENIKNNWKNYLIGILVLMILGNGLLGNLITSGNDSFTKSLDIESGSYSRSYNEAYYPNSNGFAADETERKKIKNANLNLETNNYDNDKTSLKTLMTANNAIILSENEYKYKNDYRTINFQLKINAENLETFIDNAKQYGEVQNINIYSNDVTGTYADYTERIQRYNNQIETYKSMLNNPKMEVEDEIKIQNRIDSLEDQLFYLNKQISNIDEDVAYSDVKITLKEKPAILTEIDFLGLKDGFKLFMNSLEGGLQTILVLIGFCLPFGIIYIFVKLIRKPFKKKIKNKK